VVTIAGNNFGTTGSVTFNGTTATPTNWTATAIVVPVPVGATTGDVTVTVGGVPSTGFNFTVTAAVLLNTSRYQHSATLLNNGKVLIAGGVNCLTAGSCTYLSSAELYDPATGNSAATGSLGTARSAPAVFLANGKVFIAGGSTCNSNGNCASLSSAEIYDPASGTFASAGNMAVARDGHTMTLLPDGTVLIAGGETCRASHGGGASENRPAGAPLFDGAHLVYASFTPATGSISCSAQGSAELYDPVLGSFAYASGSLNVARYNAAATRLVDGRVLIVGGSNEFNPLSSTELYNPSAGSFIQVPSGLGTARSSPVATLLNNGLVLITGGSTCEAPICPTNTAELYDPTPNAFQYTSGGMNVPRAGHTADLLTNGQVILAGGNSSCPQANSCTSDPSTESYDPFSDTFSTTQAMTAARSGHSGTALSNGSVLFAGGIASGTTLSSVELYVPSTTVFPAPKITSLSATSGAVGASVAITGTNFGAMQGTSTVTFNGTAATPTGWSTGSIMVPVPAGATTGNIVITIGGVVSNGVNFTVVPTITSLSPASGTVGTFVTIAGTGFGSTQGTNTVTFNGTTATTIMSWGATSIVAAVPTGASTGNVVVNASGVNSNGVNFAVVPAITSVSPSSGAVGAPVTITGSGFGAAQGSGNVWLGSTYGVVVSWSDTQVVATIASAAKSGTAKILQGGVWSNSVPYAVGPSGFVATTGAMGVPRHSHTATQLLSGKILIAGGIDSSGALSSAEIYDPSNQIFAPAATMTSERWLHTATLLNDGTVLLAGGSSLSNQITLDSAEIYNPATGTLTLLSSTLNTARVGHTATLLDSGQVLIVGGYDPEIGLIADAELYDPPTQTFIDLGDTNAPRYGHTATMLQNGQVLIAGGETDPTPSGAYNTAEIFDPVSQTFTPVPVPMTATREGHAAVLLNNGQVLITGGDIPGTGSLNTAEIYDPTSNTFTAVTSTMTVPRISHAMRLLNGGEILINGGATDSPGSGTALNTAEFYDPTSQTFTIVGNMTSIREHQTTSLLNDGTVLVTGGTDGSSIFNTAELYMPSHLTGLTGITVSPSAPSIGAGVQQRFTAVGTFSDGSTQTLSSVLWSSSSATVAPITGDATNSGVAATAAQGTTTIAASAAGVSGSATLTVTTPTLVSITLSPQGAVIPLDATQQFTATGVYTDGSTQDLTATATWSSSATVVAAINGSGLAAGLFEGTATIQVNSGSVSASTTLSVAAPALVSIAVTPATATIALGTSQQYQAIGTYSDGSTQNVTTLLSWSSGTPAVAAVTHAGRATGLSQGTATLTGGFESISVSVTLTVGPPNLLSITVVPNAVSLSIGATQQLSVTGTYTDGSTQNLTASSTWVSSNPNVIGVSGAGLATAVSAGNATITATSGSASGTAALVVTAGTTHANLNTSRYQHSVTILNNGQILVAGGINCPTSGSCTYLSSAELYNPGTSAFTNTGAMATARSAPDVLLNAGKVLVAGGYTCDGSGNCSSLNSAEIYDPTTGTFSSAGTMTVARSGHTMTALSNGTVLIAGGENCTSATSCSALSSAEIYDPNAGTFTSTNNYMSAARFGSSAVLLNSGSVLVAGGFDGANLPAAAEIYSNGYFTWAGPSLSVPRFDASATLLNNGQVLVAGGSTCSLPGCPTNAAEIYDPVANTFSIVAGGMIVPRFNHTATLLTNGNVVVAGGYSSCGSSCSSEASTEFLDPVAATFRSGQPVATALAGHTGTLVATGDVLLIGGIDAGVTLASDEWYQPINLTPPDLESIAIAPASSFLMPGQTEQLVATGMFNDGSTQTLQSVIWNSSNPSVAAISNSAGRAGIVSAQAQGATTVTATAGDVSGSASLEVAALVSLTIAPANPSITVGSGQHLTASGTFLDGTVHDLTSTVTWSSSNNSVVVIGSTASVLQGFAMGVTSGTATITAVLGSTQATTLVTVQAPVTPVPPHITTVSPPVGAAGMQVTVSGSGFGSAQGGGTVWLGSTYGTVVTWSDTQIVATVAAISQSGTVQVQQDGLLSNAVPFNVNTATILNVSPASGVPGTQVTITGSGFGAAQGYGKVWLGTANGVVQSWSDTQVVAEVALGAMSGNAQILQNGVMSNAVPFAVNALHIASVTPNSGGPGTSVTITGTGFGVSQGSGQVWLGSTNGQVMRWSDTQVVAVVVANAVSGVVKIEQNGVWSNAVTFTVPNSDANAATIVPNMLNLVVGETHTIQALNASGQPVMGLTWTSSNPKVVSLSTDEPPILTALAPGNVAIIAGAASAVVTVFAGALPTGTVIWSNPGNGSGVTSIVPAVPSAAGVADVFAFQADGTVQAITSDGRTAWTADVNAGQGYQNFEIVKLPDFQGGLVVATDKSIVKLDGITGKPYPAYTHDSWWQLGPAPLVHPDGTIFITDFRAARCESEGWAAGSSVMGIDATTGTKKFSVPYPACAAEEIAGPLIQVESANIIAGDGYAYFAYTDYTDPSVLRLMLLRVGTDGSSSKIDVMDWGTTWEMTRTNYIRIVGVQMITNADRGVVLSWWMENQYCDGTTYDCGDFYGLATTSGGSLASSVSTRTFLQPLLQAQDGSFYGWTSNINDLYNPTIVKFNQSGNVQWSVPNDFPQIATADGGVIGSSGITYDSQGRATGQVALPTQSWTGNAYPQPQDAATQVAAPLTDIDGSSFWPQAGGNPSANGTSIVQCPCLRQSAGTDPGPQVANREDRSNAENQTTGNQPAYVLLVGDPGLNLGDGHNHNIGNLFNLSAQTLANSLSLSGNNRVITQRVSSVNDFNDGLMTNGSITGGVFFFGHGGRDSHGLSALFPGELAGNDAYNITALNVRQLSNKNLGNSVSITLNACHAGLGNASIAQQMANQLKRTVYAPPVDMFFSANPNPHLYDPNTDVAPSGVPTYMVPNSTAPLKAFYPQ